VLFAKIDPSGTGPDQYRTAAVMVCAQVASNQQYFGHQKYYSGKRWVP
jgi:hypothetical protein